MTVVKVAEQHREVNATASGFKGMLDVENVERVIADDGTAERTSCIMWKYGWGVLCRLHRSPSPSLFFIGSPRI